MKKLVMTLPVLLWVGWLCGCASVDHRAAGEISTGTLAIRLTTLHGMQGSYQDARVYLNGRFVGNYDPDGTELVLARGTHEIRVEVPRVYSRQLLPNGSTLIRQYSLTGTERVEVLGGGGKQSLVFNEVNLKLEEDENED
jgi:hypothetical protein